MGDRPFAELTRWVTRPAAALAPLIVATILYVAVMVATQPIYSSDRPPIINPTPMLYGVALIRTPPRFRLWIFPLVIGATFVAAALGGGGGDSLADPIRIVGHAFSRALGMLAFIIILDAILSAGIDIRRPSHIIAIAGAMIGSIVFRGFLLPLLVPSRILHGPSVASQLLHEIVPHWRNDYIEYGFGQAAGVLGLMAFAPPALILTGWREYGALAWRRNAYALALALGMLGLTWFVFTRTDASLLFLIMAALVATAFFVGFFGASLSVLAIGVLGIFIQLQSLERGTKTVLDTQTLTVQLFLATTTGIILLVAGALEQRRQFQAQVERARQAAEEAGEVKSRFLATMSHEIRSPLASMTLLASKLKRATPPGDERAETVKVIERISRRVLDLLDGVLSYARFEAVGHSIERSPTDVTQLVDDIVSTLSVQAADRNVGLTIDGAEMPGLVALDRIRVGQVLTNLISNAIRHANREVAVSSRHVASSKAVLFEVRDDGVGIPRDTQNRMFDPYYRAAGNAQSGHVGLGLAICRELVEVMGGTIGVRSAPAAGTTLWFELPTTTELSDDVRPTAPYTHV